MKKKITLLTCVLLCAVSMITGAVAVGVVQEVKAQLRQDFTVKIDGEVREFKNAQGKTVYPILYEGTTYLPVRAIGEIMGKTAYWNEEAKTIELKDAPASEPTVTDADVIITDQGSGKAEPNADTPKVKEETPKNEVEAENTEYIGEEAAKKAALERAGITADGVWFERVEMDRERGIWVYEVDFQQGRMEYNVEVNALTGEIVKYEAEIDD